MNLYFANDTTVTSDKNGGGQHTYNLSSAITTRDWHYFVFNRNANGLAAVYIDGVRSSNTETDSYNYDTATDTVARYSGGYWHGHMTNFRVTIGSAVYDSNQSNYSTPRAPLTAGANTTYLMLGDVVTTDSAAIQTVTNNNSVLHKNQKPF